MKTFSKIQSNDQTLNLVQDSISKPLNDLLSLPLSSQTIIPNVSLINGTTNVPHGQGHPVNGWLIVKKNANVTIYDSEATNPLKDRYLQLVSTGVAIVDVMVF